MIRLLKLMLSLLVLIALGSVSGRAESRSNDTLIGCVEMPNKVLLSASIVSLTPPEVIKIPDSDQPSGGSLRLKSPLNSDNIVALMYIEPIKREKIEVRSGGSLIQHKSPLISETIGKVTVNRKKRDVDSCKGQTDYNTILSEQNDLLSRRARDAISRWGDLTV
jgi:hypothetical protein